MVCEKKLTNSSDPYTILQPIGIVSSSPTHFHSENIGLIRVTYDPLSVLGLINIIETYTQV